jgi:hypothetical protein
MVKAALMDNILKLIVEDINVTRADQISKLLHVDYDTVLSSLLEMEKSGHIRLMTAGGENVYVIILKLPGRQFYKSSQSYAGSHKEMIEHKPVKLSDPAVKPASRKTLTWTIIGIVAAIILALIIGYKQGWFS